MSADERWMRRVSARGEWDSWRDGQREYMAVTLEQCSDRDLADHVRRAVEALEREGFSDDLENARVEIVVTWRAVESAGPSGSAERGDGGGPAQCEGVEGLAQHTRSASSSEASE